MIAIISLLVVLMLSLSVTRVAAVALRLTGMTPDAARFQARSAFTGCGFTTAESEQVSTHPVRRRIAAWLMLAGNLQIAAVSGTIILSLLGITEGETRLQVAILVFGLLAIFLVARSAMIDRVMCAATSWLLRRYSTLETRDFASVLHIGGDYSVAEVPVDHDHALVGRSLASAAPHSCGLVVLGIARDNGTYDGLPAGETVIRPHETLVVYGRPADVSALDAGGVEPTSEVADA